VLDYPESVILPPSSNFIFEDPTGDDSDAVRSSFGGTARPAHRVLQSAAASSDLGDLGGRGFHQLTTVGMKYNVQAPKPPIAWKYQGD
jgi:hypothetical protein